MRQHANRKETELITCKGQQLTGQSPTICPCGKIIMNQLADHVNNIHAKQTSRQKALEFRKLPSKKRHKPSRKKIYHPPIHIMPEE